MTDPKMDDIDRALANSPGFAQWVRDVAAEEPKAVQQDDAVEIGRRMDSIRARQDRERE